MHFKFTLSFLLCLLFSLSAFAQEKLIFAIDVIRHGDRTPLKEIPTVSYHWKEGLGQLTATGMQQEYQLGEQLRKKYVEKYRLLPPQYAPDVLYVRSTDIDRTLMSAQALLMGLYPLGTGPLLPNGKQSALPKTFQPIPIHTVPREQETLFSALNKEDPLHQDLVKTHVFSKPEWKAKKEEIEPKFKHWSNATGIPVEKLEDLISLADILYIYQLNHAPLPKDLTSEEVQQIIETGQWVFVNLYKPSQIGKLMAHPALKEITHHLHAVKQQKNQRKYILFSAHDSTLLSIMSALGAPLTKAPPYASHINFSLYEMADHQYQVRIEFNGQAISMPGCSQTCSLDQFLALADFEQKFSAK